MSNSSICDELEQLEAEWKLQRKELFLKLQRELDAKKTQHQALTKAIKAQFEQHCKEREQWEQKCHELESLNSEYKRLLTAHGISCLDVPASSTNTSSPSFTSACSPNKQKQEQKQRVASDLAIAPIAAASRASRTSRNHKFKLQKRHGAKSHQNDAHARDRAETTTRQLDTVVDLTDLLQIHKKRKLSQIDSLPKSPKRSKLSAGDEAVSIPSPLSPVLHSSSTTTTMVSSTPLEGETEPADIGASPHSEIDLTASEEQNHSSRDLSSKSHFLQQEGSATNISVCSHHTCEEATSRLASTASTNEEHNNQENQKHRRGSCKIAEQFPSPNKNVEPPCYIETVRKKVLREDLPGFDCSQCERWYAVMDPEGKRNNEDSLCTHTSRHRYYRELPKTPEGYWEVASPQDVQDESQDAGHK